MDARDILKDAEIRVLHVVGGRLSGGAARGARILSDELARQGVSSQILCADPEIGDDDKDIYSVASDFSGRTSHFLRSRCERWQGFGRHPNDHCLFSPGRNGIALTRHPAYRAANIIHLHWINGGMLSIEGIGQIDKPLVWTIRDMWPFTGGCHYSLDCFGYTKSCGACPQLHSKAPVDLSSRILDRKNAYFPSSTTYVGISSWISEAAASSSLLSEQDIRTISNCIDTSVFHQVSQAEARARLGLPQSAKIVLAGALSHSDRYKGHAFWHQAKNNLPCNNFRFASFGASRPDDTIDFDFGVVTDDQKLRDIYGASDVLVFPSLQEAFGKVAAEAMASGTPVVSFDATGLKDIVLHKATGYAAKPFSSADLAAGIVWCLEDRFRLDRLSNAAANEARIRFAPSQAAHAYIDLYREKLS